MPDKYTVSSTLKQVGWSWQGRQWSVNGHSGSVDDEQVDTLPLPSMYEGDLDPVTSKSTLLEPRYKDL